MTEFIQEMVILVIYRTFTIACGLAVIYLGYLLLRSGAFEKAGERQAASGDRRPTLRQIAPGACFALVGFLVLGISVWRGIEVESVRTHGFQIGEEASSAEADRASNKIDAPKAQNPSELAAAAGTRGDLPEQIRSVLIKASSGQLLADSERKLLGEWVTLNRQVPANNHDQENQPKEGVQKKKKAKRIPVPVPGEV